MDADSAKGLRVDPAAFVHEYIPRERTVLADTCNEQNEVWRDADEGAVWVYRSGIDRPSAACGNYRHLLLPSSFVKFVILR